MPQQLGDLLDLENSGHGNDGINVYITINRILYGYYMEYRIT